MQDNETQEYMQSPEIKWNNNVQLIISDVDETIADNYTPAEQEMIDELALLLEEGKVIFMVSGASLERIRKRIVDRLPAQLRRQVIVAHCSGAEVWGFKRDGELQDEPYYSLYDSTLTDEQKGLWREKVEDIIDEFKLEVHEPGPALEFRKATNENPLAVQKEDRGPQITLEMVNGYDMSEEQVKKLEVAVPQTHGNYDLRIPVLERADQLFAEANLPITPRLGGMWAVDFAIKGVNKTTAVETVLTNAELLESLDLPADIAADPDAIEVWGDRFSTIRGGTDRHISEALPKEVRAIDFREEDPNEFEPGYNVVVWNGKKHLHHGLLEYLKSRHAA